VQQSPRRSPGRRPRTGTDVLFAMTLASVLGFAACSSTPSPAGTTGASTGTAGATGGAAGATGGGGGSGTSAGAAGDAGASGGAGAGAGAAGTAAGGGGTSGAGGAGPGVDAGRDAAAEGGVSTDGDGDFMIGPAYTLAPELTVNPSVAHGVVHSFNIASSESPIFPGVTGAYTRQGWIYIPAGYVPGTAMPFIIAQDGRDYMNRLPPILDNMIAAKRVPPMIALMIMAGPGDGPGSERGFEYDTVSDAFTNWVETCVLPKMTKTYDVAFTTNPDGRATMGGSSGGSAAFSMGWFHSELYHRILSFSGSFVTLSMTAAYPQGAWEYPDHLVGGTPAKPLRVWMEAAEHDNGSANTEASMKNWLIANQKMKTALEAQGYHVHYAYALGAMHNDTKVWDLALPGALEWLWRGYAINP
jgi:enterochelin esterase family protein